MFTKRVTNWQGNNIVLLNSAADAATFDLDAQYAGYNVGTLFNSGEARIDGAEYEMRQSLDRILPHWAKALTASITYSYTNLIGQPPNSDLGSVYVYRGPVFLTYSSRKFRGSLGYLRNGPNSNGVNSAAGVASIQTQVPEDMFDFNAAYRITKKIQIFASGKNILGEWRLREARYPGVPNYAALNSSTNRGVTFTLGTNIYLTQYHDGDGPATSIDYNFAFNASQLSTLSAYIANGHIGGSGYADFGLGFDPDCHYYNNGVSFVVAVSNVPDVVVGVPEGGATLALLGLSFGGLLGFRRVGRRVIKA